MHGQQNIKKIFLNAPKGCTFMLEDNEQEAVVQQFR
jgi:hypothetical protein